MNRICFFAIIAVSIAVLIIGIKCQSPIILNASEIGRLSSASIRKIDFFTLENRDNLVRQWPDGFQTTTVLEDIDYLLMRRNQILQSTVVPNGLKIDQNDTIILYTVYSSHNHESLTIYLGSPQICVALNAQFSSDDIKIINNNCQKTTSFVVSEPIFDSTLHSFSKLVITEFLFLVEGELIHDLKYLELE
jgi:hypothetical protein